jgi:anaerobic selenocysteine-containing dehydrogenase
VHGNAFTRAEPILRTLGEEWRDRGPFAIAAEIFRRILDHPEGVEIGRVDPDRCLELNIGFEDKKIRLAPAPMMDEIGRAAATDRPTDPQYPFVLAAGLRTQWTANTIQRDPAWRKGRGPHCALNLCPSDAAALGIASGDRVRLSTRRGSLELPAAVDKRLQPGHVWVANGFGARYPKDGTGELSAAGVNLNFLTASEDRDPFTGCPQHKYTLCRVERCE